MTGTSDNPTRRALLVGINEYPKLAQRYQLDGCVNDVKLMADILQNNFGFPKANITMLANGEATRDSVLDAMDALVANTAENDIVVIHYSGHGSQRTALHPEFEPDGLDETIVPHDSGRGSYPNRDITDDEIYVRLLGLTEKTPYVTFMFDCCHSGSITRDLFGAKERWLEPDLRPIEELGAPPVDLEVARAASRDLGASGWLPLGQRYVLIAGCRDEESSFEHHMPQNGETVVQGALTYFLSRELLKAGSNTTYRDVFERVSAQVTAEYPRQHPQMEGTRDRVLFDVRDIKPMRFVPVEKLDAEKVTLLAGAAHGMTVGSQWAIYPPATKQVTEETPRNGLVEITTVRAVSSDAKIIEGAEEIAAGDRAVEEAHFYGEMRMVVDVQAPAGYKAAVGELERLIENSDLLRQAGEAESSDLRVYLIAPREKVEGDDPVPQLGTVAEATWVVVGKDGRLQMPTHLASEAGVASTLLNNMEKVARYQQALALTNANTESLLEGKVEMKLRRQKRDGTWVEAEPEDDGGEIVYVEGDRIAIEITNNHTKPVYVSLLDFGLTGAVSLLHPIEGASEQLAPGKSIEIGTRQGDEVELYMPDDFPFVKDPHDLTATSGTETIKLIATSHEADFSTLAQDSYRSIGLEKGKGFETPLVQLLDMALTGYGLRDAKRNRVSPDEDWTTVVRKFTLRKKL